MFSEGLWDRPVSSQAHKIILPYFSLEPIVQLFKFNTKNILGIQKIEIDSTDKLYINSNFIGLYFWLQIALWRKLYLYSVLTSSFFR